MNHITLVDCPQTKLIPCENVDPIGLEWLVPDKRDGFLEGYNKSLNTVADKPSADSIRVFHVYDKASRNHYYIAVDDAFVMDDFRDLCNACCGENPEFALVNLPELDLSYSVEDTDNDGDFEFIFPVPYNPNGLDLDIASSYFDGVAGTPSGGPFANAAALLTWLQANEAAQGTWSLINSNKSVKLVSTTVESAALDIDVVAESYCFTVPNAGTMVDGIKIGGNISLFPGGAIDANNKALLVNTIKDILPGVYDDDTHAEKIQYTGTDVPQNLTLDGADVANTTFVAGVCTETFNNAIPALGGGEHYEISAAVFNGLAASTPAAPGAGTPFAAPANILTWVQANWNEFGTWSLQGGNTVLRLVSPNLDTAVVTIAHVA